MSITNIVMINRAIRLSESKDDFMWIGLRIIK